MKIKLVYLSLLVLGMAGILDVFFHIPDMLFLALLLSSTITLLYCLLSNYNEVISNSENNKLNLLIKNNECMSVNTKNNELMFAKNEFRDKFL